MRDNRDKKELLSTIETVVCDAYGTQPKFLHSESSLGIIVEARFVACLIANKLGIKQSQSFSFGKKSKQYYYVKVGKERYSIYEEFAKKVDNLICQVQKHISQGGLNKYVIDLDECFSIKQKDGKALILVNYNEAETVDFMKRNKIDINICTSVKHSKTNLKLVK